MVEYCWNIRTLYKRAIIEMMIFDFYHIPDLLASFEFKFWNTFYTSTSSRILRKPNRACQSCPTEYTVILKDISVFHPSSHVGFFGPGLYSSTISIEYMTLSAVIAAHHNIFGNLKAVIKL